MGNDNRVYRDIADRTGGDIYIGVVGPVRTGKSTFIKKFMDIAVIPNIENKYEKKRASDAAPQSADGRTITTTEPKFIPDEAVKIKTGEGTTARVRLVDCVGYLIPSALGTEENGEARMVHTPWSGAPLPFAEAAELGTRKVISEHSTVGILVTTDGTVGDIPREEYEAAETKVAELLASSGKPYVIILNSAHPENERAVSLAYELEHRYGAPVALINCLELDRGDITEILGMLLREFPLTSVTFSLPAFMRSMPRSHPLFRSIIDSVTEICGRIGKMGDLSNGLLLAGSDEQIEKWELSEANAGNGAARVRILPKADLYYRILSEISGLPIESDGDVLRWLTELSAIREKYEKLRPALEEVERTGYGIVMPSVDELRLSEPEVIRVSGGYGLKLRAAAKSIHMVKADIETELRPTVGSEEQSEELLRSLAESRDTSEIWDSNLFGRTLYDLVSEGIQTKLRHLPEDARKKLSETLERIVNEGSNGLICILL